MINWKNLDTLTSFEELKQVEKVNLAQVMSGESGAQRVRAYSIPMAEGLTYHYAAKQVDDKVIDALAKLADEAQLAEKFEELYNGAVINTGENRLVLHHLTRGQLGKAGKGKGRHAAAQRNCHPGEAVLLAAGHLNQHAHRAVAAEMGDGLAYGINAGKIVHRAHTLSDWGCHTPLLGKGMSVSTVCREWRSATPRTGCCR